MSDPGVDALARLLYVEAIQAGAPWTHEADLIRRWDGMDPHRRSLLGWHARARDYLRVAAEARATA